MARVEASSGYAGTKNTQEKCGVTAVLGKHGQDIARLIPLYQDKLTNRGHDASGATVKNLKIQEFVTHKGPGRARDVFTNFDYSSIDMEGSVGIGHNRYQTSIDQETDPALGIQPIIAEYQGRSIAIAYNGNLPDSVREILQAKIPDDMPLAPADIDTYDIARAVISSPGEEWEDKFKAALGDIQLAYSLTMLTDDGRLFGLRCPRGTWPLWFAQKDDKIIFASESRVEKEPDVPWQTVRPGELAEATPDGVKRTQLFPQMQEQRCSLNDLYGARFDSLFTDKATYGEFRRAVGRRMAQEFPSDLHDANAIIGVPETGLAIAQGVSDELGIPAVEFIGKNKPKQESKLQMLLTISEEGQIIPHAQVTEEDDNGSLKSFIQIDQAAMLSMIDAKFDIPNSKLANVVDIPKRKVILVDDTMIRGNTMAGDPTVGARGIINRLRDNGVEEVHISLAAPKFIQGCDQGYYIKKNQLIAIVVDSEGKTHELANWQIAEKIGANSVNFLSIEGLKDVYEQFTADRECACMACMGEPHPLEKSVSLYSSVKDAVAGRRLDMPREVVTINSAVAAD